MTFDRLSIPLGSGAVWLISGGGTGPLDPEEAGSHALLPEGWRGVASAGEDGSIAVKGDQIRLLEGVLYEWIVWSDSGTAVTVHEPHFSLSGASEWVLTGLKGELPRGRLRLINFLGLADIPFELQGRKVPLRVEFISRKIGYDDEYRAMTEDIAQFCSQLLLKWNTPTGLRFSPDPEERKRMKLEQFLFLRHFLGDRRFEAALEVIRNRPHSELVQQRHWGAADAATSPDFLSSPGTMTRDWRSFSRSGGATVRLPGEVLEVTKRESHDTAPNRFVRFALEQFDLLCREVADLLDTKDGAPPSQASLEAAEMSRRLRAALSMPLLSHCGRLTRVPFESQVLQKREGYRDILRAWVLLQSASSLNWDGRSECYLGTSRNVDLLYEYWIFLTLHRILDSIEGLELLPGQDSPENGCEPFLKQTAGELDLNLEKGKGSLVRFSYRAGEEDGMFVHLYYERKFYPSGGYSWSGKFQPDYTLVMFPVRLKTEKEAAQEGKLSFLHFDAKYRAEKLTDVFGDWINDDEGEDELAAETKERLYQPDDLLKMHTYNDAIRRTAGSYVLYPGVEHNPQPKEKFQEILPGVGAFVLKPGNGECEAALQDFMTRVMKHHCDRFTQFRYLADMTHEATRESPGKVGESGAEYTVARRNAPCVMQWLKKEDSETFRKHGFAYCHAVYREDSGRNRPKLQLDLATGIGSEFIPFGGGRGTTRASLGWRARIAGVNFLTKERLEEWLEQRGIEKRPSRQDVTHYLLFEFEDASDLARFDVTELAKQKQSGSDYMAFTCRWEDLMACPVPS